MLPVSLKYFIISTAFEEINDYKNIILPVFCVQLDLSLSRNNRDKGCSRTKCFTGMYAQGIEQIM
jgi:hypothetical protein